jgi:glycosyltransferase involved in cell wall biosynthesis
MRIDLAFAVPPGSVKSAHWHDGFTAAMDLLSKEHQVRWLNLHPASSEVDAARRQLNAASSRDVLLAKSNWGWIVDTEIRRSLSTAAGRKAILVSGTAPPPSRDVLAYYHAVLYETPWYSPFVSAHPCTIHSFGIDTRVMYPNATVKPDIDWLSVGQIVSYKGHEKLIECSGKRVVIGDTASSDVRIRNALQEAGVTVLPFVSYGELADYYRRARNILVNCTINGGGERAVLEGRACGRPVHVAGDNKKLRQLSSACPVWDHEYHGRTIERGLTQALAGNPKPEVGCAAYTVNHMRYLGAMLHHRIGRRADLVSCYP